jgi:hypothetical protein
MVHAIGMVVIYLAVIATLAVIRIRLNSQPCVAIIAAEAGRADQVPMFFIYRAIPRPDQNLQAPPQI